MNWQHLEAVADLWFTIVAACLVLLAITIAALLYGWLTSRD